MHGRTVLALALAASVAFARAGWAAPADEAQSLYARFVAAQNAHDFTAVRQVLLESEHFLWVSNGLSFWGPEAALRRMMRYHTAETWRIEPDNRRAVAVEVNPQTAYLHVPLALVIGPRAAPERHRFLVSALCTDTPHGWRIAALFTTDENVEGE